jgi:uncharacterized protein (DUF58 family)
MASSMPGPPAHAGRWVRVQEALAGKIKQRVTALGMVFGGVTLLVGISAFATANNLLFLILAAMISTLLVSGFISRLGLAGLQIDLEIPDHVSARLPCTARMRLQNDKAWMPSFSIHLEGSGHSGFSEEIYFPLIPGNAKVEQPLTLRFPRRGQYKDDSLVLSTRFPLGFTERRVTVEVERDIIVYPSIEPKPGFEEQLERLEGEVSSKLQGRGEDFHRIRPYEHNESARHVDWKATAHTGELQVREYVRREQPSVEIVLDLRVSAAEREQFEQDIECCAFLAWSFYERRLSFRFRSQLCDLRSPEDTDVYGILRYLALVEPRPNASPLSLEEEDTVRVVFSPRRASPGTPGN